MRKNVKIIASLVRKAKRKLQQDKRDEALDLMKKAVNVDDNNGVLVQIIQVIGKKKSESEVVEEPVETTVEAPHEEPVETTVYTHEEEILDHEPESTDAAEDNNHERISSMSPEEQLIKLFKASDMEYDNGHQQKAIAYLKKARKLNPDDPDVQLKIELLKIKIKSANLIQIGRKKLKANEVAKAVVLAKKAFQMMPEAKGLDAFLSDIENESITVSSRQTEIDAGTDSGAAVKDYIVHIRQLVQNNSLEDAASFAENAFRLHPQDRLLVEFIENFKKLGLIE